MYRSLIGLSLLAGAYAQCNVTLPTNAEAGDCGTTMADGDDCMLACASGFTHKTPYGQDDYDLEASCVGTTFTHNLECNEVVGGCIDGGTGYCNFNENANTQVGFCVPPIAACSYCSGETDGNGTVIDGDVDDDGVCDVNACDANHRVQGNECVECPDGTTNAAGDDKTGDNTECDATLCLVNERVQGNQCVACDDGYSNVAGDDASGNNTVCDVINCAANQRVQGNECVECPDGTTNVAGDDASQGNTECDATLCQANERVQGNECVECPDGTTNVAGDDASQGNTECDATLCQANERVQGNQCVACDDGYSNVAGDDASQGNTECDPDPCVATNTTTDNGIDGNFYCRHGDISGVTGSCVCTCKNDFDGTNCDVCPAGKGVSEGVCAACEYPQANPDATYTSACVNQTCADGYGVVEDGIFNTALNASDQSTDNCVKCNEGFITPEGSGICRRDTDGDGQADIDDSDDDNDGVPDTQDTNSTNPLVCRDSDGDGCDDCSVTGQSASASVITAPNITNDGDDFDSDGTCDAGDTDIDNDGALNVNDSNDFNATVCSDTENDGAGDGCDDCSLGTFNISNDGDDFDEDDLCDAGDPDIDNDGRANGLDSNNFNATVCADTDNDKCDDCSSGTFAPDNDGDDFDSDDLCDAGDPDIDNDGRENELDSNNFNANVCADTDNDTCDDCSSGTFAPGNDGLDTDGDGTCDLTDDDIDGDGIPNDQEEYGGILMNCTILDDCDGDGVKDNLEVEGCILLEDCDGDGLTDSEELTKGTNTTVADTDGDGLKDGAEVNTHNTSPTNADTDGDGLTDHKELTDNNTHTNALSSDTDGDGVNDDVDLCNGVDDDDCCHAQKQLGNAERYIALQCCVGDTASCSIPEPVVVGYELCLQGDICDWFEYPHYGSNHNGVDCVTYCKSVPNYESQPLTAYAESDTACQCWYNVDASKGPCEPHVGKYDSNPGGYESFDTYTMGRCA